MLFVYDSDYYPVVATMCTLCEKDYISRWLIGYLLLYWQSFYYHYQLEKLMWQDH